MAISKFIYPLAVTLVMTFIYSKYKNKEQMSEDDRNYDLVRKFLLNDGSNGSLNSNSNSNEKMNNSTTLAKCKKPILWIHSTYEVNARAWQSFSSRNTEDLNQPYVYLTMKSIIDRCSTDFNICLIDDQSFAKLLPTWAVNLSLVAEPIKSNIRQLALANLLYTYGGISVPNSFLCFHSLLDMYLAGCRCRGGMFVGEFIDRQTTSVQVGFFPDPTKLMGCSKNSSTMQEYVHYLEKVSSTDFTAESEFEGDLARWCLAKITDNQNQSMHIVPAEQLGTRDSLGKPVTIERLLSNTYLPLAKQVVGLYLPAKEIISRTAFQWFSRMSAQQVLKSDTAVGKYMLITRT